MTQTDPFATNEASESKTKTADPFGQADGSAPSGDLFGNAPRPDSEFLNATELKPNGMIGTPGALVLIRCDNAQIVTEPKPAKFAKKPGEMQDKLIVDTAALDGPHAGRSGEGVWWFNDAITKAVRAAQGSGLRCILGRVAEVPTKAERDNAKDNPAGHFASDIDDLPEAYDAFKSGKRREKPGVAIILADHTPDDAVKAREFLAAHPEFLR